MAEKLWSSRMMRKDISLYANYESVCALIPDEEKKCKFIHLLSQANTRAGIEPGVE
jgi:hypothetical protein